MKRSWVRLGLGAWLVIVVVVGNISCTSENSRRSDEYERAIQLMDDSQFSEAIYIMESKLKRDPKDMRARKLLAAAYAGRAGVKLKDFIDLSELVIKTYRGSEKYLEDRALRLTQSFIESTADEKLKTSLEEVSQWLKALYQLEEIIRVFNNVPKVKEVQDVKDVRQAVLVLEGDGEEPLKLTEELSLYRALLRITIINYDFRNTYKWSNPSSCDVDLDTLIEEATDIKEKLVKTLEDVAQSSVSEKSNDRVLKMARGLEKNFDDFLGNIDSLDSQLTLALLEEAFDQARSCK